MVWNRDVDQMPIALLCSTIAYPCCCSLAVSRAGKQKANKHQTKPKHSLNCLLLLHASFGIMHSIIHQSAVFAMISRG
jgi:hypothetical protein